MSIRVLLTGGRAPVTLDLARLFSQAGHHVIVADSLPQQLCSWSRAVVKNVQIPSPRNNVNLYIQSLAKLIQQEKVDWLVPTCEEIYYIAYGHKVLQSLCHVFVEPLEKLEPLHNKWRFIQTIQSLGLPVPETTQVTSQDALKTCLSQTALEPVILKPVYSRFASHVKKIELPTQALPTLTISSGYPWVVQEFIEGQQYCLYGVAHRGSLKAYAAYPVGHTAAAGSCIYFEVSTHPPLLTWMQTVVKALNFTGQIAFDVIETASGTLYPLECNPRAISAIHLFQSRDHLDQAFFGSSSMTTVEPLIQPHPQQQCMIGLAMMIYGLPAAIQQRQVKTWWHHFVGTRDVLFCKFDPAPFFGVGPLLWQFWNISRRTGQTLQQASTQDIEWDGEPMNDSRAEGDGETPLGKLG